MRAYLFIGGPADGKRIETGGLYDWLYHYPDRDEPPEYFAREMERDRVIAMSRTKVMVYVRQSIAGRSGRPAGEFYAPLGMAPERAIELLLENYQSGGASSGSSGES